MEKDLKLYLDQQFRIIHEKLEEHDQQFKGIDKQFRGISNKLEEHDRQFIKIDEHFEALTEAVNAGTKDFNGVKREIAIIKDNIREKLGVDI